MLSYTTHTSKLYYCENWPQLNEIEISAKSIKTSIYYQFSLLLIAPVFFANCSTKQIQQTIYERTYIYICD